MLFIAIMISVPLSAAASSTGWLYTSPMPVINGTYHGLRSSASFVGTVVNHTTTLIATVATSTSPFLPSGIGSSTAIPQCSQPSARDGFIDPIAGSDSPGRDSVKSFAVGTALAAFSAFIALASFVVMIYRYKSKPLRHNEEDIELQVHGNIAVRQAAAANNIPRSQMNDVADLSPYATPTRGRGITNQICETVSWAHTMILDFTQAALYSLKEAFLRLQAEAIPADDPER